MAAAAAAAAAAGTPAAGTPAPTIIIPSLQGAAGYTTGLRFREMSAAGLRAADVWGTSDPFMRIYVGRRLYGTTDVVPFTLNPNWGSNLIDVPPSPELEAAEEVRLELFDKDAVGEDPLGVAILALAGVFPREGPPPSVNGTVRRTREVKWVLPVFYRGQARGTVRFTLDVFGFRPGAPPVSHPVAAPGSGGVAAAGGGSGGAGGPGAGAGAAVPNADEIAGAAGTQRNCLLLTVVGVTDLKLRLGLCYPFVRVAVAGQAATTKTADESNATATFGQGWAFGVQEPTATVNLLVQHARGLFPAQYEGQLSFPVSDVAEWTRDAAPGSRPTKTIPLQNRDGKVDRRGSITLAAEWVYNATIIERQRSLPLPLNSAGALVEAVVSREDREAAARGDFPDGATGEVVGPTPPPPTTADTAAATIAALSSLDLEEGDWRVVVHVIEARGIRGANWNGTVDPVVYVDLGGGRTQHTPIRHETSAPVFDYHMVFQLPAMRRTDVEALTATVALYDSNSFFRNELIGRFAFDALEIYAQRGHEYTGRWVALANPDNPAAKGIQGFLKLTIAVLGPSDRQVSTDAVGGTRTAAAAAAAAGGGGGGSGAAAAAAAARAPGDTGAGAAGKGSRREHLALASGDALADFKDEVDADALVLLPPTVRRSLKWLVLNLVEASGLPSLDTIRPGIDAYAEVRFAGCLPQRTRFLTVRGPGNLTAAWKQQLWIPFQSPFLSTRVTIAIRDYDVITEDDTAGTLVLDGNSIAAGGRDGLPGSYWPIYGAPPRAPVNAAARAMNTVPDLASTYNGTVFLSARIADVDEDDETEVPHSRPLTLLTPPRPPMKTYRLAAFVCMADELPVWSRDMGVAVSIGGRTVATAAVRPSRLGQATWNTTLTMDVSLPMDGHSPLPDTIVSLYYGDIAAGRETRFAYARIPTAKLRDMGFAASVPYWQTLSEDTAFNCISDSERAGSVLLRLAVAPPEEAAAAVEAWAEENANATRWEDYDVRVHVYQGRSLASADANGSLDPYLRVSLQGITKSTTVRYATRAPAWYETLSFPASLPSSLSYAPQLHVELWDRDLLVDDFVAEMRYNLGADTTQRSPLASLPKVLERPTWFSLMRLDTGTLQAPRLKSPEYGELLLGVQLIRKPDNRTIVPAIPRDINPLREGNCRDCYLDMWVLGCRDLAGYALSAVNLPAVHIDVGPRTAPGRGAAAGVIPVVSTIRSRFPTATNPNFCQRFLLPVRVPCDAFFGGAVTLTVSDAYLNGMLSTVLGTATLDLADKITWSESYKQPRSAARVHGAEPTALEDDPPAASNPRGAAAPLPPWAQEPELEASDAPKRSALRRAAAAAGAVAAARDTTVMVCGVAKEVALPAGADVNEASILLSEFASQGMDEAASMEAYLRLRRKVPLRNTAARGDGRKRGGAPPAAGAGAGTGALEDDADDMTRGDAAAAERRRVAAQVAAVLASQSERGRFPGPTMRRGGSAPMEAARGAAGDRDETPAPEETAPLEEREVDVPVARRAGRMAGRPEPAVAREDGGGGGGGGAAGGGAAGGGGSGAAGGVTVGGGMLAVGAAARQVVGMRRTLATAARDTARSPPTVRPAAALPPTAAESLGAMYGLDLTRYRTRRDASGGVTDAKHAAALAGRHEYSRELEEVFQTTPFEKIPLYRGMSVGAGVLSPAEHVVGYVKGIVRLVEKPDAPPPLDPAAFSVPKSYVVRVYVLTGHDLTPTDPDGLCDPYLVIKLGSQRISARDAYIAKTLQPDFYQCYELTATLPGAAKLSVEVWDRDLVFDDYVGATRIDLEDRLFEPAWAEMGAENESGTRYRTKPVETRYLYNASSTGVQGAVRMWVDILSPAEAAKYPMLDITPTPPQPFELRAVVWKTRGVVAGDVVTNMSDTFVKGVLDDKEADAHKTDIHWRSNNGQGSFNWRMKWQLELPKRFFRLKLQVWDQDIAKYSDCLGEVHLDLGPTIRRALDCHGHGIQILRSDTRVTTPPDPFLPMPTMPACGGNCMGASTTGVPPAAAPAPAPAAATAEERDAAAIERLQSRNPLAVAVGMRHLTEVGAARASVAALKDLAGFDVYPRNAQWVPLYPAANRAGQAPGVVPKPSGEVLMTLELLPKSVADAFPAGQGRDAPNANPRLPAPIGRVRWSANPCYLLNACCGARIFTAFICCLLFIAIATLAILGFPFLQTIEAWISVVPKAGQAVIWAIIALFLCCPPIYCYSRFVLCPRRERYGVAVLGAYASDDGVPTSKPADVSIIATPGARGTDDAGAAAANEDPTDGVVLGGPPKPDVGGGGSAAVAPVSSAAVVPVRAGPASPGGFSSGAGSSATSEAPAALKLYTGGVVPEPRVGAAAVTGAVATAGEAADPAHVVVDVAPGRRL